MQLPDYRSCLQRWLVGKPFDAWCVEIADAHADVDRDQVLSDLFRVAFEGNVLQTLDDDTLECAYLVLLSRYDHRVVVHPLPFCAMLLIGQASAGRRHPGLLVAAYVCGLYILQLPVDEAVQVLVLIASLRRRSTVAHLAYVDELIEVLLSGVSFSATQHDQMLGQWESPRVDDLPIQDLAAFRRHCEQWGALHGPLRTGNTNA